ncbi:MAG: adenylate/guanylate cyclase domain-containing protein [Pseudomonadota bacterium]
MTDISGSTGLYERTGNATALAHVDTMLVRMRAIIEEAGGVCVKSQGDDALAYFATAEAAFQAGYTMITEDWPDTLSVHSGMYLGEFIHHEDDIYGAAVNTAARLASLAKPGELLLGDSCVDHLSEGSRARIKLIGDLALKGKPTPTRVYACTVAEMVQQTVIFSKPQPVEQRAGRTEFAEFRFGDNLWKIKEGQSLSIGRAADCDIVIDLAWVSRSHATLTLRHYQLEIADHSSTGSVLVREGGEEVSLHRRATLLSGAGVIYCGIGAAHEVTHAVHFSTHTISIAAAS